MVNGLAAAAAAAIVLGEARVRIGRPGWDGDSKTCRSSELLLHAPPLPSAVKTCTGHTRQGICNERAFFKNM